MVLTKYLILLATILLVVPLTIRLLEHFYPNQMKPLALVEDVAPIPKSNQAESFSLILFDLLSEFAKNIWMLLKPTVSVMLLSAILASAMLVLIPWTYILSEANPLRYAIVSLFGVIMPVPIALDVMFASQLLNQGVDNGYVMLFLMTLGTYSIVPMIYLWREISKLLSVLLFLFFFLTGLILGMIF
jgi:uncharacterized membrane protein YraQ (UPF0718 family)